MDCLTVSGEGFLCQSPRVQVLLSTYNGSLFLPALLDSLSRQNYGHFTVFARDDGSTDDTASILNSYRGKLPLVVEYGHNIGVVRSFFDLLCSVAEDAEYVAFCDQDDVWLPDKLSRAVQCMKESIPKDTPGLYCSRFWVVDKHLHRISCSPYPCRGAAFKNALVQNIVTGCTTVLNRPAIRLVTEKLPRPEEIAMFDWWFYLVISAFGQVFYDFTPTLLYRQHEFNLIGSPELFWKKWGRRINKYCIAPVRTLSRQAHEFERLFGQDLSEEKHSQLTDFLGGRVSLGQRLNYIARCPLYRQDTFENILLRLLILFNRV